MAEELKRMDDRSRKKRASDIGADTSSEYYTGMCDRLAQSYPSPRCRSAMDKHCAAARFYGGVTKQIFGSPSYPSPLDRIRTGRKERAKQLGLPSTDRDSFEANQSFPKIKQSRLKQDVDCTLEVKKTLEDFKGDGLNDVSYTPGLSRGSFAPSPNMLDSSGSLSESWSYFNYIGGGSSGMRFPTTVRNPNKAIVTIDAKTSEILVANEMASELFGFSQEELIGIELNDLVTLYSKQWETIAESHLEDNGEIIEVSGKVVDAVDSSGLVIPVSLWIKRLDVSKPRCLVVMEPLERTSASVTFDSTGTILDCDNPLAVLHGYADPVHMMGLKMNDIIPSLKLPEAGEKIPEDIKKQRATGLTKDGATFPLSVYIERASDPSECGHDKSRICPDITDSLLDESDIDVYYGIILVFANISGLITVLPNGKIHSINNNFALMLFGFTQSELIGKDISEIIPDFHNEVHLVDTTDRPVPPFDGSVCSSANKSGTLEEKNKCIEDEDDDVFVDDSMPDCNNSSFDVSLSNYLTSTAAQPMHNITRSGACKQYHHTSVVQDTSSAIMQVDDIPKQLLQNRDSSPESLRHQVKSSSSVGTEPSCDRREERSVEEPGVMPTEFEIHRNSVNGSQLPTKSRSDIPDEDGSDDLQHSMDMLEDNEKLSNISGATDELMEASTAMISEVLCGGNSEDMLEVTDKFTSLNCEHPELTNNNNNNKCSDDIGAVDNNMDTLASTQEIFSDIQKVTAQLRQSLCDGIQEQNIGDDSNKENDISKMDHISDVKQSNAENEHVAGPQKPPRLSKHCACPANNPENNSGLKDGQIFIPIQRSGQRNSHAEEFSSLTNGLSADMQTSTPVARPVPKQSMIREMAAKRWSSLMTDEGSDAAGTRPSSRQTSIVGGSFLGQCRHKDGSRLGIVFQVKQVHLADGQTVYCVWVSRDPDDPGEGGRSCANLTLASSLNNTVGGLSLDTSQFAEASAISLGERLVQKSQQNNKEQKEEKTSTSDAQSEKNANISKPEEEELTRTGSSCQDYTPGGSTEYDKHYDTLNSIGKGAFGFVKLALRKSDKEQVVVKFIKKSKLSLDALVDDPVYGRIPPEVSILSKLRHPNIVTVLDCFEGPEFFHLVMEKHGSGMDLFEFIDRCPNMDEPLASFIFRQLVSAVSYLHDQGIVHRDVKDENVILNEQFQVKLIDFGSAAYLKPGHLFATFCGTLEYCCPEVIQGNKYKGPELEVWSLGVTLYTLVFGENPFYDVLETTEGKLSPPFDVSEDLMNVIHWMLHPDPKHRATVKEVQNDIWVTQPIDIDTYSWEQVMPNCEFNGNTASDNRDDTKEGLRGRQPADVTDGYSDDIYLTEADLDESFKLDLNLTPRSEHDSESSALEREYKRFLDEEMSAVDDLYSDHSCQSDIQTNS